MSRLFLRSGGRMLALLATPCLAAALQDKSGQDKSGQFASSAPAPEQMPREVVGSTSAVPGDRVVCLYDKPSRKMICRTFDQWRVIGIQRSAKRNFEKR